MPGRSAASVHVAYARPRRRSRACPFPTSSWSATITTITCSLRPCAQGAEPQFITPLGLGPLVRRLTLQNVIELDWWETADLGDGRTVTCVPAQHFSARTPFDRNRTLWCGFVLHSATETIYFA